MWADKMETKMNTTNETLHSTECDYDVCEKCGTRVEDEWGDVEEALLCEECEKALNEVDEERCSECKGEFGEDCAFESKNKAGLCKDCAEDDDPESEDEEEEEKKETFEEEMERLEKTDPEEFQRRMDRLNEILRRHTELRLRLRANGW